MNEDLITELKQGAAESGAVLVELKHAIEVRLNASGIEVAITVPRDVLEWWVEVADADGGCRVKDWCDYEGYDSTPREELVKDMKSDVLSFFAAATTRALRFSSGRKSLEWEAHGQWQQAVPITEPNNALQPIARETRSG